MIIHVNEQNIINAASIHSISWKESHRDFCTPEFIEIHSPERQLKYICEKMNNGTEFFMLVDEDPVGVVSVADSLIEDLYVLPEKQNMGNMEQNYYSLQLNNVQKSRHYGYLRIT